MRIANSEEERAMFACNDPTDSLVATFEAINGSFQEVTGELSEAEPVLPRQRRKLQEAVRKRA
jgi:hypothetical protein